MPYKGLRPLLVLHTHTYHHSHRRGNKTAPYGRPNFKSRLNFGHNLVGGHEFYMDMWGHWRKKKQKDWWEEISGFSLVIFICGWQH
jgi:hypothetical protein